MQELFFGVGGLLETLQVMSIYSFTKGEKSINAEKNENVELTHTQVFCGRLCVVRVTVTKNKLYWWHGFLLVQNTDCRLQTADRIQNVD